MQEHFPNHFEIPNRTSQDVEIYRQIKNETCGKFFFCDNFLSENIRSFTVAFEKTMKLKPQFDHHGDLVLLTDITFRGKSYLKTTITTMRTGKPGEPVIIVIPGYGDISQSITIPLLMNVKQANHCGIIGINVFHDLSSVDRVKVSSKIQIGLVAN